MTTETTHEAGSQKHKTYLVLASNLISIIFQECERVSWIWNQSIFTCDSSYLVPGMLWICIRRIPLSPWVVGSLQDNGMTTGLFNWTYGADTRLYACVVCGQMVSVWTSEFFARKRILALLVLDPLGSNPWLAIRSSRQESLTCYSILDGNVDICLGARSSQCTRYIW